MAGADGVRPLPFYEGDSSVHVSAFHRWSEELPWAAPISSRVQGRCCDHVVYEGRSHDRVHRKISTAVVCLPP